jgi:hypothetical protein
MTSDQAIKVLKMIEQDCTDDANSLDGQPFDGKTVAKRFGEIYAMIKAVAGCERKMLESAVIVDE